MTYAEVRAALARARRAGRLGRAGLARAKDDLEQSWQQVVPLVVDSSLIRHAGDLAEQFALRAYDAVHLAAAITVTDVDVLVATWDGDLAEAARAAGLSVAP